MVRIAPAIDPLVMMPADFQRIIINRIVPHFCKRDFHHGSAQDGMCLDKLPFCGRKGALFVDNRFGQRSFADVVHSSGLRNVGNCIPKVGRQKADGPGMAKHHLHELTEIVAVHPVMAVQVLIQFLNGDQLQSNMFHYRCLLHKKGPRRTPCGILRRPMVRCYSYVPLFDQ